MLLFLEILTDGQISGFLQHSYRPENLSLHKIYQYSPAALLFPSSDLK